MLIILIIKLKGHSFLRILKYYDDIHTFVTRLCLNEKLHQSCISTAMVFFHKYFIFKKGFENDLEKYLTCSSCILLAVKVCNQLTPLEELVNLFLRQYIRQNNLPVSIDDQLVFETCEKLCSIEFQVLNSIGFDLNVELPYKYVYNMKFYYFDYLKNSKLLVITNNFINDSFKLPLCLYYDPLLIALASLYLASVYFKVPLPDTKEGVKWFNILDKTVELKEVILISEKINKIYKFCNESEITKTQLVNGNKIIKFDPNSIIILEEELKLIESNLDVNKSTSGSSQGVENLKRQQPNFYLTC
jgi:hypothetical protein